MRGKQTVRSKVYQLQLEDGGSTQSDKEAAAEWNGYFAFVFVKYKVGECCNIPDQPIKEFPILNLETEEINYEEKSEVLEIAWK